MADLDWLTTMVPLMKEKKGWEILKEHVALLTAQRDDAISLLNKSDAALADAKEEIARLKSQVADLEKKIRDLTPASDLKPETLKILQCLFAHDRPYLAEELAEMFELEVGIAKYHCEALRNRGLVTFSSGGFINRGRSMPYAISPKGRSYLVDNNLVWKDPRDS